MNKKLIIASVIAAAIAFLIGMAAVLNVATGGKIFGGDRREGDKVGAGQVGDAVPNPTGSPLPAPGPENTVVGPGGIQLPDNEPFFIPAAELPTMEVGPNDTANIRTSGPGRTIEASRPIVICSPMPTDRYWVELENGKLGDRTYNMNFWIDPPNFKGNGVYEVPVGMVVKYPDGSIAPFADTKARVEINDAVGSVKGEFMFTEGLTSVSLTYRCGGIPGN